MAEASLSTVDLEIQHEHPQTMRTQPPKVARTAAPPPPRLGRVRPFTWTSNAASQSVVHRLAAISLSAGGPQAPIQRAAEGRDPGVSPLYAPPGGGRPLPDRVRAKMERAFDYDFSKVRVHLSGAPASIGARAFARGHDLHFKPGAYDPASASGQELIGHELTHVVQQAAGRVAMPQGKDGLINDSPHLEAEADRGGARAARGLPVRVAGRASAGPASFHAAPIQPAWERVNIKGKVRNLNLRDNKNGTWTHWGTKTVFHDIGVKHNGKRLLHVKAGGQASGSQIHDPKNVLFNILPNGKVEYLANKPQNRKQYAGKFLEMDPVEFAQFKSGGKRTPSQKIMDPVSLDRYYYDSKKKKFHIWDRSVGGGKGAAVNSQLNKTLASRLAKNELVDRRREDRRNQDLLPFDLGTYKAPVSLSHKVDKLSGVKAWNPKGRDVNRDHIPSGKSLDNRGGKAAYNQGITIAIPNPGQHQGISPTYGGKQQRTDTLRGKKRKRVDVDTENPQIAVHRDITHMLRNTRGRNYPSHPTLNLQIRSNRHRQLGAYRKLMRYNVQIRKKVNKNRGFDPDAPGYSAIADPQGKYFTYQKQTGMTQGELLARFFMDELHQHQKVKYLK
ncbi:MAG: DUF4157 domain-containing protein [Acidobacteriota bacterium]